MFFELYNDKESQSEQESEEKDEGEKVERLAQNPSSSSTETLPLIKSSKVSFDFFRLDLEENDIVSLLQDCLTRDGRRKRQPAKEELRRRQEEHLRRSLVDDNPL